MGRAVAMHALSAHRGCCCRSWLRVACRYLDKCWSRVESSVGCHAVRCCAVVARQVTSKLSSDDREVQRSLRLPLTPGEGTESARQAKQSLAPNHHRTPTHRPTSPPAHQSTHPPPAFVHAPSGAHDPFPRPPSLPALPYPPASQPCSTRHDSVARKTRGEQSHALTLPTPATTLTKARQGKARQAQHSPLARPRAPTTGEKASCARCTALRARALANCLLGSHCACAVRSRERFAG